MIPVLLAALGWLKPAGARLLSALRNPYVVAALAVVAALLLWRIEESRIARAQAQTAQAVAAWRAIFSVEQTSFRAVDSALKLQNAAVTSWASAGRQKTARAATAWASDNKALEAAEKAASSRQAPDPKGDPAAEADTIFRASRGELP